MKSLRGRAKPLNVVLIVLFLSALTAFVYLDPLGIFKPEQPSPTPSSNGTEVPEYYDVPVLAISYLPLEDGKLDPDITGMNDDLASMRRKVGELTDAGVESLTRASIYHGYKDSAAKPFLKYSLLKSKEFLTPFPLSSNEIPWNLGIYRPDYDKILSDLNICDYVDNKNVKQVWLWGYHHGNLEPVESDMAMGTVSRVYWNYGTYGDVSNSERKNDLPICEKTYTLYNYNYGRGLGELLENHGHQLEAVFSFVDSRLWNKFVHPYGEASGVNHCGWTHCPPNTKKDYDWTNESDVLSDCEDWKPDGSGEAKVVDCHTWCGDGCLDDGGVEFKVWWMQNIPGKDNNLVEGEKQLRNWWEFYGDFDRALQVRKELTY